MRADAPLVQVRFTEEFEHRLNDLAQRFTQVRSDLRLVIEQLQMGIFVGAQISGAGREIFKVRVKNSDVVQHKHLSYHLIYEVASPTRIVLLTLYFSSDRTDASTAELQRILVE